MRVMKRLSDNWLKQRETIFGLLGVVLTVFGFLFIVIRFVLGPCTRFTNAGFDLFGIGIGLVAIGLALVAVKLSWKSERVSEDIRDNTESALHALWSDLFHTVYNKLDTTTKEQPLFSLDAIGSSYWDVKVMLFFPVMKPDDLLTLEFRTQQTTDKNSDPIVWSRKVVLLKGPKAYSEYEVYDLGFCVTQTQICAKNNIPGRGLSIRGVLTYAGGL